MTTRIFFTKPDGSQGKLSVGESFIPGGQHVFLAAPPSAQVPLAEAEAYARAILEEVSRHDG